MTSCCLLAGYKETIPLELPDWIQFIQLNFNFK